MATLFVDKLDPQSGTALEIGTSGDTVTVPSGATFNVAGTLGSALTMTPAFQAYLSSNQTITEATDVKLACDTELFDTDGCYDNSSNYRFTPDVAGKYMIYSCATFTTSTDTNMRNCTLMVHKNGSRVDLFGTNYRNSYVRNPQVYGSVIVDFNGSSDYVEMYSFGDTQDNANPDIVGGTNDKAFFGAYKLIGV